MGPSHLSPSLQKKAGRCGTRPCDATSRGCLRSIRMTRLEALWNSCVAAKTGGGNKRSLVSETQGWTPYSSLNEEANLDPQIKVLL